LFTHDIAAPVQIVFQYEYRDTNQLVSNVATVTVSFYSAFQNQSNRLDVNADGSVSPLDVLEVINYINARPGESQLPLNSSDAPPFVDVDGDGFVTPLDALIVVNTINQSPTAAGEGEGPGEVDDEATVDVIFSQTDQETVDWLFDSSELELDLSRRTLNRVRGIRR
jgi:hypothetical protein